MFIQTESTPNPNTLKFLPGRDVAGHGSANFTDAGAAGRSPLARRLFGVEGVAGVFLGADFVSVSKSEAEDWSALKPMVLAAIMDHFASGAPSLDDDNAAPTASDDNELVIQIKDLLDKHVRPSVAGDGGDIVFRGFEDGIVYLHMQGSCHGCPSSTATLKHGIENLLRYYVPEVRAVEAVD